MVKNKLISKSLRIFILIIIPVVFLLAAFHQKKGLFNYSLVAVDPEMAYLYNSLTIAHGHYTHFVDHPGIPLQYIGAGVIGVVSIFRVKKSITQDVITNPDFYIHSINIFVIILLFLSLILLGYHVHRFSKSIYLGLLVQLTPFISYSYLSITNRLLPELLSLIVIAGLFIVFILYSKKDPNERKRTRKYIFLMALFISIGISSKITLMPLLLIPYIVLSKLKEKIQFLIFFLVSATFFLIPALNRGNHFFSWIKDLFIHSGQYGKGDANIVELSLYKNNLLEIWHNDLLYVMLIISLIIGIIVYQIPKIQIKRKNDVLYRVLISFVLSSIIITMVIAKQLKLYYLSPALLLIVPGIVSFLFILSRKVSKKYLYPSAFGFLFIAMLFANTEKVIQNDTNINENNRIETLQYVEKNLVNVPIINVPNYYGSPFKGYTGYYGIAYSGKKNKEEVIPELDKVFPNYFTYHDWNGKFNYWLDSGYTLHRLMNNYDSLFIYLGDEKMRQQVWFNLIGLNQKMDYRAINIYENKNSGEEIYKLYKTKDTSNVWKIVCDAEGVNSNDNYLSDAVGIEMEGGVSKSLDHSLSGKSCSKLDQTHPYSFGTKMINVKKRQHFIISVWKYNNDNQNAVIVFEPTEKKEFYKTSSTVVEERDNWKKITMDIIIPDEMEGNDIKIYCWCGEGNITTYMDDFSIERIE